MYYTTNQHRAIKKVHHRAMSTGRVIKNWRIEHDVTQEQLANLVCKAGRRYGIKVSSVTISAYEREKFQPKSEIAWGLCKVMHMKTWQLNGYVKDKHDNDPPAAAGMVVAR